ncbi:hypothetical protein B0H14DRAFT_3111832 [Mycena olivaceomarginata]|nr:hypothetical protein B0H14DRAFT_3111832 [Mycena olivaceomarginata]
MTEEDGIVFLKAKSESTELKTDAISSTPGIDLGDKPSPKETENCLDVSSAEELIMASMNSIGPPADAAPSRGRSRSRSPPPPQYYTAPAPVTENPLPTVAQTRCYWALLSANLEFVYLDPAQELVGKSLITFVHPEEQSSAQQDLGNVLESRTLHGSAFVFSRLSRVRRELGYQGPQAPWGDADKIAQDSNYMTVDIVINWAAEGVVLCFIHPIVDLTPRDNDESQKSGWSNWCGTPTMNTEQLDLLFRRLVVCIPQLTNMNRVFQIFANDPNRRAGAGRKDFAKLVEDIQIGPGAPTGNEAKTSCTRRYKALQSMPAVAGEVESIFIPHAYSGQTLYYEHQGPSYGLPPLSAPTGAYNYLAQSAQSSPSVSAPYSPPRWSQPQSEQPSGAYGGGQWSSSSAPGHSTSNLRSGSYPPPQGQQWPSQPPSYIETTNTNGPTYQRPLSPAYGYTSPTTDEATSPATDVVPAPETPESGGGSSGRSGGTRPAGVLRCSSCKTTTSSEWRKGPSGKKELCNACGLRYARSRAKKEGNQAQRKEKGAVSKRGASATPPSATSSTGSYSAIRRNYDDSTFSTTGSGSPSTPSPPASNMNLISSLRLVE